LRASKYGEPPERYLARMGIVYWLIAGQREGLSKPQCFALAITLFLKPFSTNFRPIALAVSLSEIKGLKGGPVSARQP
jgi:hypothetical protein